MRVPRVSGWLYALGILVAYAAGMARGARNARRARLREALTREAREVLDAMAERGSGGLLGIDRE